MKKTLLVLFAALGLAFLSNAQEQDRDAIAKAAVTEAHNTLLSTLKTNLEMPPKSVSKSVFGEAKDSRKQFLVENGFIVDIDPTLGNIYEKLGAKKNQYTNTFVYNFGPDPTFSDEIEVKAKKSTLLYSTRCKITVNSTDKEGKNSSVKNNVTFVWKVPYNKPKNKVDGKLVLVDVKVAPSTEERKEAIVKAIKLRIAKWYNEFNTNDPDFPKTGINPNDVMYIVPQDVDVYNRVNISIKEIGDGNMFDVKYINREKNNVPSIKILATSEASERYITEDRLEYDEIQALWEAYPRFVVRVHDKEVTDLYVYDFDTALIPPATSEEKVAKKNAALSVANDFRAMFVEYASLSPQDREKRENAQLKKDLLDMFENPKDRVVEFTLVKKNGDVDATHVQKPTTPQSYLKNLPQVNMDMEWDLDSPGFRFVSGSYDEICLPFIQTYRDDPKKYGDKTLKELYLKYIRENGTWVIYRIRADENFTVPIEPDEED